jgi:predicted transcriptional regulator
MQHFLDISQIEARALAINLPLKKLARMATVDPSTVFRAKNGADTRVGTLRKLTECLERQEARVFEHMKKLARSGGGRQTEIFGDAA